jgi:phosphoribosylformylglycinamidine synthase
MTLHFKQAGDLIYLIGKPENDLASSEYLYSYCGVKASPAPAFDLETEYYLQQAVGAVIKAKLVQSAHDISDGGLWTALTESAIHGKLGYDLQLPANSSIRLDAYLFGESQSRVIVSVNPAKVAAFEALLKAHNTPFTRLGSVRADGQLNINGTTVLTVSEARELYEGTLPKYLD